MSNLQSQVESIISAAKKQVNEAVENYFAKSFTGNAAVSLASDKKSSPTPVTRLRQKNQKRDAKDIDSLKQAVVDRLSALQGNGEGIEKIAKALEVTTKELALPMKKLIEQKSVYTTGTKRATKYFWAAQ